MSTTPNPQQTADKRLDDDSILDYFVAAFTVLFFGVLYHYLNGGLFGEMSPKAISTTRSTPWFAATPVLPNNTELSLAPLSVSANPLGNTSITESLKPIAAPSITNNSNNDLGISVENDKKTLLDLKKTHQDALINLRDEMTTQQQTELTKLRAELEGKYQSDLASLRSELAATQAKVEEQAKTALAAVTATPIKPEAAQAVSEPTETNSIPFEQQLNTLLAQQKTNTPLIFDNIHFEMGSNQLTAQSKEQVRKLAELLKQYPAARILIQGFTDNIGDMNQNTLLSLTRSNNMKKELVVQGIAENRIKIEGMGSLKPIASNDTEEGRSKNRRIEVSIIE